LDRNCIGQQKIGQFHGPLSLAFYPLQSNLAPDLEAISLQKVFVVAAIPFKRSLTNTIIG